MTFFIILGILFALGIAINLFNLWDQYLNDPKGEKAFARKYLKTLQDYKKSRKG